MVEIYLRRDYDPNIIFKNDFEVNIADYQKVAEVNAADLAAAWHLTQNDNKDWTTKDGVKVVGKKESYRSSSIGDVFSIDGQLQIIMPLGYELLNWGDKVSFYANFMSSND